MIGVLSLGVLAGNRMMSPRRIAVLAPLALVLAVALPAAAPVQSLRCDAPVPGVTWMRWTKSGQATLEDWCASVGPPYVSRFAVERAEITRLLIVTWNVHVGGGQLEEFVAAHWTDRSRTGLVLLIEETYRGGQNVPVNYPAGLRVPSAIKPSPRTPDITELANRLRMSVAYVPSMRNGPSVKEDREDRGNAILSTEPLADVRAIELPFGRQRRVAVAATVTPRGAAIGSLRVIATHFDVGNARVAQAEALGERVAQLDDQPLVVGGDFNSLHGLRDKAVQAVGRRIPMESCGTGRTFTWPRGLNLTALLDFGRFDFMFSTLGSSGLARECRTIDDWFHSDHRPVMLTVRRP